MLCVPVRLHCLLASNRLGPAGERVCVCVCMCVPEVKVLIPPSRLPFYENHHRLSYALFIAAKLVMKSVEKAGSQNQAGRLPRIKLSGSQESSGKAPKKLPSGQAPKNQAGRLPRIKRAGSRESSRQAPKNQAGRLPKNKPGRLLRSSQAPKKLPSGQAPKNQAGKTPDMSLYLRNSPRIAHRGTRWTLCNSNYANPQLPVLSYIVSTQGNNNAGHHQQQDLMHPPWLPVSSQPYTRTGEQRYPTRPLTFASHHASHAQRSGTDLE